MCGAAGVLDQLYDVALSLDVLDHCLGRCLRQLHDCEGPGADSEPVAADCALNTPLPTSDRLAQLKKKESIQIRLKKLLTVLTNY